MSTPQWLRIHTLKTGDNPSLVGTKAHPRHCRTCGRLVLAGYDAPVMGSLAICDPNPLSSLLEAACVILRIRTYQLWGNPGHYELSPRHQPDGCIYSWTHHRVADECVVLAEHRCGKPPLTNDVIPVAAGHSVNYDGPPPF